jgi:cellulose synthase/poly-beta-1,6-N-acetylglucosamine synthase-like glycosyltransferase
VLSALPGDIIITLVEARLSPDKTVSVIVPSLNSPLIDQALTSLKNQTFDLSRAEVLIVGQDEHQLIVENKLIRFIYTESPVIQSIARNIGVRHARGDILVFIDADCIAAPDWLQRLVNCFKDPNIHLVGGGVIFGKRDFWTLCDNIAILYDWLALGSRGTRAYLASLNMAMRRTAWKQIGGFDETFAKAEDTELSIRARLAGYQLYFEPQAIVTHQPAPSRNHIRQMMRRAFESGYWTLGAFARYQDEIALPLHYRSAGLILLSAPLTAAGVVFKIFRRPQLRHFWYTLPAVYVNKLLWRIGGAYRLWQGAPRSQKGK